MSRNLEAIEDDIERIRNRMETRLDSLNNDLTPSGLLNEFVGKGSGSPLNNLGELADKAKANPMAAALIGAGIVNLFFNKEEESGHNTSGHGDGSSPESRIGEHVSTIGSAAEDVKENASAKVSAAKAKIKGKAQATGEAISHTAEDLQEAASNAAHNMSKAAGYVADTSKDQLRRVPIQAKAQTEGAVDWIKENPVPAGLIALALGAAASSFFTARKTTSRLSASKELHEEARENLGDGSHSSFEPPKTVKKAAKKPQAKTKAKPKRKAAPRKAAASKAKAKPSTPIPTRTAKARNIRGKPDSATTAATAD